ncbi:hypothetical protein [Microbacterium sp. CFBP9034]|uniref:hypothetical protein n=1 Tax=Microbacterium sp. CFBP9034 TaxID=3096540 RepID=UPI002A69D594|nr:hypothetical protein [Microbacterium sp. CFBP9034]MDY0908247.1 hypothetical protein [Microbacterium sp. CFBP9034]
MGIHVIEIIVRGRLGPELSAALDGFSLTAEGTCTRIVGSIPDQARLLGLLEMLDQLHVEVVSVNPIPADIG